MKEEAGFGAALVFFLCPGISTTHKLGCENNFFFVDHDEKIIFWVQHTGRRRVSIDCPFRQPDKVYGFENLHGMESRVLLSKQ